MRTQHVLDFGGLTVVSLSVSLTRYMGGVDWTPPHVCRHFQAKLLSVHSKQPAWWNCKCSRLAVQERQVAKVSLLSNPYLQRNNKLVGWINLYETRRLMFLCARNMSFLLSTTPWRRWTRVSMNYWRCFVLVLNSFLVCVIRQCYIICMQPENPK